MTVTTRAVAGALALLALPLVVGSARDPRPAEPRPAGAVHVAAGGRLQDALDRAVPGDVILLDPGAVYEGPFTLPRKAGSGWITVRSADPHGRLPPPGTRVGPADSSAMPILESRSGPVLAAEPGAHHYHLIGLELRPRPGTFLTNLVTLGTGGEAAAEVPRQIVLERSYLHGDARVGARRGIALNSAETSVVDCHLSDFKEAGADSQAIAGWGGPGPFRIENNRLEAAGENLLFGGADPVIPGLVPEQIEIRRNHLRKPLAWKPGEPGFEGTRWTVKNLLELKNARRVTVSQNLLENNWVGAQSGFAVLFTVRNQDGAAPWSVVEDVTFENNVVRGTANGVNILGYDDSAPSGQARRISIRNNLFLDVGSPRWGGGGRLFQVLDGTADVVIRHNTAFHTGNLITVEGRPHSGFVFADNIAWQNLYGIVGSDRAPGPPTLAAFFLGAVVRRNAIIGGSAALYPPDNFFPAQVSDVGFSDLQRGDYRLGRRSSLRGAASDGTDVGVDPAALPELPSPAGLALGGATEALARASFWGAALLLTYGQVGYPLLLLVVARLRPRPIRRVEQAPSLSLVIVAHDEASRIERRIDNALALDYPRDALEIVVASDGSSDDTVTRAGRYAERGVRVLAFATRRGKPAVLNEVVPRCRGSIVVLADARQRFERGALRALAAAFGDPEVGAVSGELVLEDVRGTAVGSGVGAYWAIEKGLRYLESRIDSTIGATGAIYAIRRELFEAIPDDTLLDDVVIPLRIIRRGYRVVFEPEARAFDRPPASAAQEFARKVRTIAGGFQLFARERWLVAPWWNRLWLQTVSHKLLRLLMPALLLAALSSCAALVALGDRDYLPWLSAQAAFYATAACGRWLERAPGALRALGAAHVFCLLAWATVVGFHRFLAGTQAVTWDRPAEEALRAR